MKRYRGAHCACFILGVGLLAGVANGQSVNATLTVGINPDAVAVNPLTNKIYVANRGSNSVTVIDGSTNATSPVGVGSEPDAIAINTVTNKIYVANARSNSVTVIDGATNMGITVPTGIGPASVAVNPVTNKVYVANSGNNTVTLIDGVSNSSTSIAVGYIPEAVAVNPVTNKIYVAEVGGVSVIDGAGNGVRNFTLPAGSEWLAVNPVTNKIYIGNGNGSDIQVLDGATNAMTDLGKSGLAVAVNSSTNKAYFSDGSSGILVVDGATNGLTSLPAGSFPLTIAVDSTSNKIFAANFFGNSVTYVDGATNSTTTLPVGNNPQAIAVNPVTGKAYVANKGDGLSVSTVTVIDGTTYGVSLVTPAPEPYAIAVNPVTSKVYIVNVYSNFVTVVDSVTDTTTTVPVGTNPQAIAVNSKTNKIYVANTGSSNVTVIDGATNSTTNVPTARAPLSIALNPLTNQVYVGTYFNGYFTIIDGATNTPNTLRIGPDTTGIVVNPTSNKIYLNNGGYFDGATGVFTQNGFRPFGSMDVNPITNKLYGTFNGGLAPSLFVVDGATNASMNLAISSSSVGTVRVNPVTNKIYAASSEGMLVVDGTTNTVTVVPLSSQPNTLEIDPVTNRIFATVSNKLVIIDGVSNAVTSLDLGTATQLLAVNSTAGKVYDCYNALGAASQVRMIRERSASPSLLSTAISGLPSNVSFTASPNFTFTVSDASATVPDGVYFQTDTWQNAWTKASGSNPFFSAPTAPLRPGVHTLYAFAGDSQEATSTQVDSPTIGAIQAYSFFVTTPFAGLDVTSQGTWNGQYGGDGYVIPNGNSSLPAYVNLSVTGTAFTYAEKTTDVRAVQDAVGSTTRTASAFNSYYPTSFNINLNLVDGKTHRVALYLLDWDSSNRAETITIVNANDNSVLDSRTFSNFNDGRYAVYNLTGNVIIQVTPVGTGNAVISGIFFGPAGPASVFVPSSSAIYIGSDSATEGNWIGKLGKDGYQIANGPTSLPLYATFGVTGSISYSWANQIADPRALQLSAGSTSGIASAFTTTGQVATPITLNLNLIDGYPHPIALYLLDWDTTSRIETITIVDAASNTVLDSRTFSSFHNGVYATWKITGNVIIKVTSASKTPVAVSGIFFN